MTSSSSSPGTPASTTASNTAEGTIDVRVLAEKVYRLLLADLSLETRRSGRGERP